MGRDVFEFLAGVVAVIVGLAALSVLLSPKSTTAQVIQASASGLSNSIATAVSPVSGATVQPDLSYPGGSSLNFGMNLPTFH